MTFVPFAGLAIIAGVCAWNVWIFSRVNRSVASMLAGRRWRWDAWGGAVLLDGTWNGIPVRIRSVYVKPPVLSVRLGVSTSPPDLTAFLGRSARIEFHSVRQDHIGVRHLASGVENELSTSGPPALAAIAEYFTPERVAHLGVLLRVLGWKRFERTQHGIVVTRFGGKPTRWMPEDARQEMHNTLVELQKMGG